MCGLFLKFKNFIADKDALLPCKHFLGLGKSFPSWLKSEPGNKHNTKTGKKKEMVPVAKHHFKTKWLKFQGQTDPV